MRWISEQEVWALAGDSECPILGKVENDASESAVCLKEMPENCWVLGISCDLIDRFELYAFDSLADAESHFARCVATMECDGTPFGPL